MEKERKVLIIIPAYNEEKNLKRVIDHLLQVCPQFDYVIVNDSDMATLKARVDAVLREIVR